MENKLLAGSATTSNLSSGSKRIAKNTIFLYIRKIVSVVINLYLSRLLLKMLGVEDFGLYGLIGSIVILFSALRSLFASSIQRFINVELGRGNLGMVNKIFSLGVKIHVVIAIAFFLTAEIAGLIMIPDLNVPVGSEYSAYWVLQFSILTAVVSIMTVPYDALIIANEKFKAYALLSIIEYMLKLGAVCLLVVSPISRVIFYAALIFIATLLVRSMNAYYCKKVFGVEARYRNTKDQELLKNMTKFAGWQFLGNCSYSLAHTGVNFVINIFGGVSINAARTIAYQVQGLVEQFTSDLSLSFHPQIIGNYAVEERERCLQLVYFSSKITFIITIVLVFVIECMTLPILQLWLNTVLPHAVIFIQIYLLFALIHCFYYPVDVLFKASGNIKFYQLYDACITILNLPLSWIAMRNGFPYYSVFIIMCVLELISFIVKLVLLKRLLRIKVSVFFKTVLVRAMACIVVFTILFWLQHSFFHVPDSKFLTMLIAIGYGVAALIISSMIIFTHQECKKMYAIVLEKLK